MMKHRAYLMAAILGSVLTACASSPRVDPVSEEQRIRELNRQYLQTITNRDINAVVGLHAPDAVVMPPNAPLMAGPAIRTFWQETFGFPDMKLTFAPTRITISEAGDLANDVGTYQFSFNGPQGRIQDEGKYSTVWRKVNGEWKIATEMFNSNMPLPEPPPPPAPAPPPMVFDVSPDMEFVAGKALTWTDVNVPGFDPGLKLAVVHGDPGGTADYTIRLRFPAGYQFPPHWHPNAEHITVLQGTFNLAMGERADRSKLKSYGVGDFLYAPAKMPHYGGVRGETVIQLHGMGPFEIHLVK